VGEVMIRPQHGLLFGNGYAAAGVPSLMAYTGMGYVKFGKALCLTHRGTCREGYDLLFAPVLGNLSMADLTKVETVVVQRKLVDPVPRPGWHVESRDGLTTVLRRDKPLPPGRVSAAEGVTVTRDTLAGARSERVRFQGKGQLTFARLAWPGYRASVNGKAVPVREGPGGLLTVDLPESGELELGWTPPGFLAGIGCALAGLLLAVALGWRREEHPLATRALRRRRREGPHRTDGRRGDQVAAGRVADR
ncbi:MAG: hypothetical protein ABW215_22310, partial [Kibdelosporangium sp.]